MTTDPDPPSEDDPLLDLALNVSDGTPVDWTASRPRDPRWSRTFDKLRSIELVAQQHRTRPSDTADSNTTQGTATLFTWGNLRVLEKLGEGGFGEVWRAWDPALEREVALKLRRSEGRERGALRWLEEARRLARVRHPHVLLVHGADVHESRSGMWTDLVRGRTLASWLEEFGALGARETALIGIDLCAALSAVHAAGIVHGDVKASNVMREGSARDGASAGRIVLMDFGAAHDTIGSRSASAGSPLYTAPEVLAGGPLTPAADLYGLGVLLYRLVSRQYPVEGKSVEAMLELHARGERRSLRALRPDLPPAFVQVVERAIDAEPQKRFRDAADMERALSAVLGAGGEARIARRSDRARLLASFALGLACCAAAWWISSRWRDWSKPRFRVAPTGAPVATALATTISGTDPGGNLGHSAAAIGDVNGDSLADLLVTSVNADGGRGSVDLCFGRRGALPECSLRLHGENPGDAFGHALAGNGDLNGDGIGDFAIGARYADAGALDAGRVYIWFGGPNLDATPDLVLEQGGLRQLFGQTIAMNGDVNGDGFDDLLVGAPTDARAGSVTGRAFVYWGGPAMDTVADLDVSSAVSTSQFGIDVDLGDLNGDGLAEMIIGSNWENTDAPLAGRVYIYNGARVPDGTPDLTLRGQYPHSLFGYPVCAVDLNGDDFVDVALGEGGSKPGSPSRVRIYFGGTRPDAQADLELFGATPGDIFGGCIEPAGDVNGDGLNDLLVGAPFQDEVLPSAGAAYVYFGGRSMDDVADLKVLGDEEYARFGWSAASIVDRHGDGFADFVVGAPSSSGQSRDSGKLYVFDVQRYAISRPRAGDNWVTGHEVTLAWLGAEPAVLELSLDGGRTFEVLQEESGGKADNTLALTVPTMASDSVFVRLRPSRKNVRGETRAGPIHITH